MCAKVANKNVTTKYLAQKSVSNTKGFHVERTVPTAPVCSIHLEGVITKRLRPASVLNVSNCTRLMRGYAGSPTDRETQWCCGCASSSVRHASYNPPSAYPHSAGHYCGVKSGRLGKKLLCAIITLFRYGASLLKSLSQLILEILYETVNSFCHCCKAGTIFPHDD